MVGAMKRTIWHSTALALALVGVTVGVTRAIDSHHQPSIRKLELASDQEPLRITRSGYSCGVERWAVKTLADPAAATIAFTPTVWTNIAVLDAKTSTHPISRQAPVETTVYGLAATHVIAFKQEGDSDIHLVLRSTLPGNPTMIAELPLAGCITPGPVPAQQALIGAARATFLHCIAAKGLSLSTSFQTVDIASRIRGVGFFDFNHGQRGVAPNAIELHPVLSFAPAYGTVC